MAFSACHSCPFRFPLCLEDFLHDDSHAAPMAEWVSSDRRPFLNMPAAFSDGFNPVCGFSKMEQVRLCAVWPTENWLGSSINHIQGWMNDLNMLLTCFRKRMPVSRSDSWNFGHRPRPQIHSDPFNPAFRTFPREKFLLSRPTFLSSRVAFSTSIRPNQNRFSIAVSYYRSILSVCAFIALH